ncbi:hypothetical protein GOODEAATRI_009164 [Goodea atripinnis]|uniref:Secreted protein n=1 Tax=Goodea atripinnis TaxID=208336 RepID=A0ABV0NT50_9TELE
MHLRAYFVVFLFVVRICAYVCVWTCVRAAPDSMCFQSAVRVSKVNSCHLGRNLNLCVYCAYLPFAQPPSPSHFDRKTLTKLVSYAVISRPQWYLVVLPNPRHEYATAREVKKRFTKPRHRNQPIFLDLS